MTDEPVFDSPRSPTETTEFPPRECLYSTPLSWERPMLGCRVGSPNSYVPLSTEEESRLRCIAMPAHSYPASPLSSLSASPEPQGRRNPRKRKSSGRSESDFSPPPRSKHSAPQKTAHNVIEKRCRTNLNDKIAALRDSVPSLRIIDKDNPCGDLQEDLQGLSPTEKLNKVIVHSRSFSFILPSSSLHHFRTATDDLSQGNHSLQSSRIHRPPRKAEQEPFERKQSPQSPHRCLRNPYNGLIRS
jgi:hypothetical protein